MGEQTVEKTKEIEIRGLRVRLGTGSHDLVLKAKKAEEFIRGGDRVQIQLTLRGREKYLDKKFIEEAIRGFFVDSKIGMVNGKVLRSSGKTLDSAGLFLTAWRTAKERGYGL